jgi:DNA-binding CsgD family transcriptional regulator
LPGLSQRDTLTRVLIGRADECERIDALLERARLGTSGALVLRGEAGIGKTALLDYAAEQARGMTVVRALGVESEAELEFSGLLEVCRPLLDRLQDIPEHQAEGLRGALGLGPAGVDDRFTIGAATLSLVAAAAEANPLLVIVDDAHWLDRSSQDALLFATKRLEADRVVLLYAVREGEERSFAPPGIDSITLGGLEREAAAGLLARNGEIGVAVDVAERLHAATGGNPLALIELPRLLSAEQLAGNAPLEDPLPAGSSVERSFAGRLDALPESSRRALLVAAVSVSNAVEAIMPALGAMELDGSALEPAEDAGLVRVADGRVEFRHPLVRSTVYHTAAPSERRFVHRTFAQALADDAHAEERAWHLAAAALEPDEGIAAALDLAAQHARERGGYSAAAAAYERAARLTPDEDRRLLRLCEAAETAWEAGQTERAVRLLEQALASCREPRLRSRLLHLRGHIEHLRGPVLIAHGILIEAAELVEPVDPRRAVGVLVDAVEAALYGGEPGRALDAARRARELAPVDGSAEDVLADLVLGESLVDFGGFDDAVPLVEHAVAVLERSGSLRDNPRYLARAAIVLGMIERPAQARELFARTLALARERGAVVAAVYALEGIAWNDMRTGRWREAYAAASDTQKLASQTDQSSLTTQFLCELAWIDAAQGNEDACRAHADEALKLAEARELCGVRWFAEAALALLDVGMNRLADAVPALERIARDQIEHEYRERDGSPWPELIEAYVRLGRDDDARAALDQFLSFGLQASPRWGAGIAARCRGLLADDDKFDSHFEEALELHRAVSDVFALGRSELCFGERLRRAGRRVEAREHLVEALETFERLDAEPWAERARRELRASGETLRRRKSWEEEELTPQELQIALQVADGKSNKEVGAALFLSHKTIEFHLSRVYRKLNMSSRAELIRRFAAEEAAVAQA